MTRPGPAGPDHPGGLGEPSGPSSTSEPSGTSEHSELSPPGGVGRVALSPPARPRGTRSAAARARAVRHAVRSARDLGPLADAATRRHLRRRRLVGAAVALSLLLLVAGQAAAGPGPLTGLLGGVERAVTGGTAASLRRVTAERDALAVRAAVTADAAAGAGDVVAARALDGLAGAVLVPARVVAWNRGSAAGDRRVTLDVGARDGVADGAAVVTGAGLAGRVTAVTAWTSDVVLLGDPSLTVAVRTDRAVGAASTGRLGATDTSSRLSVTAMVPGSLRPGDVVVTAGSPGGVPYPPGLAVGRIGAVDPAAGAASSTAELLPAVDVGALDVVTVVVVPPRAAPRPRVTATGAPTADPTLTADVTPTADGGDPAVTPEGVTADVTATDGATGRVGTP